MYHHHSQQQGPQPFSNGPRPHHQPNQHQNHTPSDMLTQSMGFQFPRPTQLPDELESALAIRGARDMDHRLIDHTNPPNQQQNQGPVSGINQHGTYNSAMLTSDSQGVHQQGVDWSNYQPPTKLFASPSPSSSHQSQRHQGPQQQPESSHPGTSWTNTVSDSSLPQGRHPQGGASSAGGNGQGMYTPESAGSILASFGLSNEDLDVLSHYPDDQLTPDTLPFILRDIQLNKTGKQKTVATTSSSSFSHSTHMPPQLPSHSSSSAHSRSSEVPSLLTVTQTAGKVIDYGHASRTKDESSSSSRETFKREQLSNEKTVKMYSASSGPKGDKAERRHIHLEHTEPSKHGDRDYRRASGDQHKSNREIPPSNKSRNLDRDYRQDGPKPRPSSETRSENSSRRSLSSSSGSKPHSSSSSSSSKTLPTPTMISDFSAASPKVYPHTCSLCHILCDQEKDWFEHVNTVNHTAACRDLRNKYPEWKPNVPRRGGRYGSQAQWDPKDRSPSHSVTASLSCSPTPSPPHNKHRPGPHPHRPHGKLYPPHPRYHHFPALDHGHRLEHHHSGSQSPSHPLRTSREHRPGNRARESPGVSSRGGLKRPEDKSAKCFRVTGGHSASRAAYNPKHGLSQPNTKTVKSGTKDGTKMPKTTSAKAADASVKPPPTKKKKKMVNAASHGSSVAGRLVYLTGIPNDASEQEVTSLVGSFGKINNVILMPGSERGSEMGEGQKASVCMVRAEDAQTLAKSTDLSIRDQHITASTAKKPEGQSSDASNSKPASGENKAAAAAAAGEESGLSTAGGKAHQKTSDENLQKGTVLITGLPEGSWSESDIIKLVQPFGTPSDIILATQIGKVLLSVSDAEIAQEMMRVHSLVPAKIEDSELKIIHVKQRVGLGTPVALYNLLMGSLDPVESPVPVGWSSLLVISNVPDTPSGSSEVQKLVQRFGTVIKTLVLNSMVIFEMATAAMALSVYKRFQTFPCIIQNNPLFFSRKPDPKAKVIAAYLDSPEDLSTNGKSSQTAAAPDEEQTAQKETCECPMEDTEQGVVLLDKKMKDTPGEGEALEHSGIKDRSPKNNTLAAADLMAKMPMDTDVRETSAVISAVGTEVEKELVDASEAENDEPPAVEETILLSCDGKSSSAKTFMKLVLPKVTQEMVNTLLVECRTRTARHPDNVAASACGSGGETPMEPEDGAKAAEETKVPVKGATEEEAKKQEKERREREVRKERERRVREREDRGRREREEERRERERRERKRTHGEGLSAPRSSCRSEGFKQSCHRDERFDHSEAENKMVVEEEEEEEEFPFNMSDFVTVDEVGDVADLTPSPSPVISMETTEGGEDAPTSVQQDDSQDTPTEVAAETEMADAPATRPEPREQVSECEPAPAAAAESSVSAAASASVPASQADASPGQSPEALDTEETLIDEHLPAPTASDRPPEPAPAENPSNSPATGAVPADSEGDKKEDTQAKEGDGVLDKSEEKMRNQVDKKTPAAETAKHKIPEDQRHPQEEEERVKMEPQATCADCSLPPFDPSTPVGLEFLVPKTGFFCKVCNRFFSGTKEAELSHCKTIKHYESLRKFLQTTKTVNVTSKP